MIAYTALEVLAFLHTQEVEREWKMAALAAQIPSTSRLSLRDSVARALRSLAAYLDPDLTVDAMAVELYPR
jgi:hypothetical protein